MCNKTIHNIQTLQMVYELLDLETLTGSYLLHNQLEPHVSSEQLDSNVARLMDTPLEVFNTLQVAVPTFNDNEYNLYHMLGTGPNLFQKQGRADGLVFVRCCKTYAATNVAGRLDGMIVAKLNALFKLRDIDVNKTCSLAHISLLNAIGSPTLDGPECMVHVGIPMKNHVVHIRDIKGLAHLISINPDNLYLVNNHIDIHTWNETYNGN